jgi:hypothetical protein
LLKIDGQVELNRRKGRNIGRRVVPLEGEGMRERDKYRETFL